MIHRFGPFELDADEARLARDGEPLDIQPKLLDALRLFVENPGRLLTREELIERLWPGVFVTEESLTQVVKKLRQLLGDEAQRPRYLETVLKRGYRFVAAVETGPARPAASPGEPAEPAAPAPTPVPAARGLGRFAALGAAGALAVAAVLAWRARPQASLAAGAVGAPAGGARRLTATPERETFPALSPDGARYAFVRRPAPEEPFELFVAALEGGETRLTATPGDEFAPQFSPDGASLIYSRRDGGLGSLWRLPALGGAPERLVADGEWGTWSPDGERVAFVRTAPGDRSEVRVLTLADRSEELLWSVAESIEALAWSPDGGRLAAVGEGRVLVAPVRPGGEPSPLGSRSEYIRSVAWSPDGRSLIADGRWLGAAGSLVRLPVAGGEPRPLTVGSTGLFHPSLSADGGRLLYAAEHKVRQIWRFDRELRAVEALSLPTGLECFDVSPDGGRLAASDWQADPNAAALVLHDLDRSSTRRLGAGLCPAFSPDGGRLAYLGHRADDLGLWVLDLSTGDRRRVAEDRGEVGLSERNAARRPAWSPDGRRIAYERVGLPEGSGLALVDLDRGEARLVAPGVFGHVAFSSDGERLAVSGAGPEAGFALVDLARGETRRVPLGGAFRASPLWRDATTALFLVDQQVRPALVAVDAATLRTFPPHPFSLAIDPSFWGIYEALPDRRGGWLVVVERYESDLFLLDL